MFYLLGMEEVEIVTPSTSRFFVRQPMFQPNGLDSVHQFLRENSTPTKIELWFLKRVNSKPWIYVGFLNGSPLLKKVLTAFS